CLAPTREGWLSSRRGRRPGSHEAARRRPMKVFNARVLLLAFLLVLIPLGPAERAAAEVPAIARLQDSRPLGPSPAPRQRSRKPFWHHGGAKSLARAKEEAAILAPTLPRSPRALVSSTVVAGFDGIDEISTIG